MTGYSQGIYEQVSTLCRSETKTKIYKYKFVTATPVKPEAEPEIEPPLNQEFEIPAGYQNFKLLTLNNATKASFADILTSVSKPKPLQLSLANKATRQTSCTN